MRVLSRSRSGVINCKCHAHRRRLQVIDDPGGNKARLEHAFNKNIWMSPEEIQMIMLLKAKMVYDLEINTGENKHIVLKINNTSKGQPKDKVKIICDSLRKWGVTHIVKDALNDLKGPINESIEIDLNIGARVDEFEID